MVDIKKIGIFAGAFDPVHDGHISVAESARDYLGLDRVLFMVEPKPWGDKNPVDVSHRRKMVDLAITKNATLSQFKCDDDRFTITETLPKIEEQYPDSEVFFILGADVFIRMNKQQWPGLEKLFKHYIVVFERKDITEKELADHAKQLGIAPVILPSEKPHHASGDVRKKPYDKKLWLPKEVADYIDKNNLY